jgi:exopolysaccharide biosynthesis polyprenyl glycosylphosphotransferase
MYKRNLIVPFTKMLFDAFSIELAIYFAYWLRFYSPLTAIFPITKGIPYFLQYFYFSIFLVIGYLILFAASASYRSKIFTTFSQDIPVILKVSFLGILLAMSGAFLYREFSFSRLVFVLIFLTTLLFLLVSRFIFHKIKTLFIKKDYSVLRIYVVGSSDTVEKAIRQLSSSRNYTFNILGYFAENKCETLDLPYFGTPSDFTDKNARDKIDGIVITFNRYDYHKTMEIIKATEGKNIELFYLPDILDLLTSNVNAIETDGLILLRIKKITLSGWQGFIKTVFDFVLSAIIIICFLPLLVLIALLIRISSNGPILYRQKRVGLDGHEFKIYKFRSMHQDAESKTGPVWAHASDPRVTRIGKIIRRTSLDELPQLFNVLKGNMSIVGPRPERPHFVKKFQSYIPKYSERHRVKSGITGWAQVNGLRGQSPIEERTRYDIFYIENWSLWFDIKIIIMTILAVIKGENAY